MGRTDDQRIELKSRSARLFSPRTPIGQSELFAGRAMQILKLIQAINQPGAHAIIYGERGVGKTSLANVAPISFTFEDAKAIVAPRINCDGTDDYARLWHKVFSRIEVTEQHVPMGLRSSPQRDTRTVDEELLDRDVTPGVVQQVLSEYGQRCHLVVTLDEFDRLPEGPVATLISDTIKSLSDNMSPATIIIVGVGESVATLLRGHESVGRHLVEVPLPRMSKSELEKIVNDRLPNLDMTIDPNALHNISLVCAGLPYYTHLLGQHAACAAIDDDRARIEVDHVAKAMHCAIQDSEREMQSCYYEATRSRQPKSLFDRTLAACALAIHDEFGYFTAADVRGPLSALRNTPVDIPGFLAHLDRFTDPSKGGILESSGQKHQRRYRFRDPLMQPFVIIKSLDLGLITLADVQQTARSE